jgi:gas vesicle protein
MKDKSKAGLRGVVLVWIIGLTLGVAAGSATALLLMPSNGTTGTAATLAERLRNG